MYVCLCQGITDKQITAAVDKGANSLDEVRGQLNIANECRQCEQLASHIINQHLASIETADIYYQVA